MDASEFLVDIDAHDGTSVQTLRISSSGFATAPSDTPGNTIYEARIKDPGQIERSLFGGARTIGEGDVNPGYIEVISVDGRIDTWINYGFDGRAVTIRRLANKRASFGSAETVMRGTVERLDAENAWSSFRLRLYDRRLELDRPLQTNRYKGTTTSGVAAEQAEGNTDIKDTPKPLCLGNCFNVPATCVNPFNLVYQVNDGAVFSIVAYDGRVALTNAGDYASLSALLAASIPPGRYATCLALGLFRLGGSPRYPVTADVLEGSMAALRRAGAVSQRVLSRMGLTGSANVSTASFAALDTAAPYEVGIYVNDDRTALAVLNPILASVGASILPDTLGVFGAARVVTPSSPVRTLHDYDILTDGQGGTIGLVSNPDTDGGLPAWRVVLTYGRNYSVQDASSLAQCVSDADKARMAQETLEAKADSAAVKTKYLLAPELRIETLLANAADALSEAARRLALYSVRRDVLKIATRREDAVTLGSVVNLVLPRFGYDAGRLMMVIERTEDLANERVLMTLWG